MWGRAEVQGLGPGDPPAGFGGTAARLWGAPAAWISFQNPSRFLEQRPAHEFPPGCRAGDEGEPAVRRVAALDSAGSAPLL